MFVCDVRGESSVQAILAHVWLSYIAPLTFEWVLLVKLGSRWSFKAQKSWLSTILREWTWEQDRLLNIFLTSVYLEVMKIICFSFHLCRNSLPVCLNKSSSPVSWLWESTLALFLYKSGSFSFIPAPRVFPQPRILFRGTNPGVFVCVQPRLQRLIQSFSGRGFHLAELPQSLLARDPQDKSDSHVKQQQLPPLPPPPLCGPEICLGRGGPLIADRCINLQC